MNIKIRKAVRKDAQAIVDVYNYFIENSFAAYSDRKVSRDFYYKLKQLCGKYPFYVIETDDKIVGYGKAQQYLQMDTFSKTATLTYFIYPEYTGKGLGGQLFDKLVHDLREMGVEHLLVNIAGQNKQSLNFHRKMGFVECGRFPQVGEKWKKKVDVVWMIKNLTGNSL